MIFNKSVTRKIRVRAKLKKFSSRLASSVFRSNKYIYAQIIDDQKGKTLVAASEKDLQSVGANSRVRLSKIDRAYQIGGILAKKASRKKIKQVYFDRGGYKYHGRIGALAKGARKGGLEF